MSYRSLFTAFTFGLLMVAGCAKEPPVTGDAPTALTDTLTEVVAELSAEDQALVDAQKICPVGGHELGGMGTPIKVMVGERPVFICCESCRKPLLADPEKYLTALDTPADEAAPATEAPATETPATETPATETPAAETPAAE